MHHTFVSCKYAEQRILDAGLCVLHPRPFYPPFTSKQFLEGQPGIALRLFQRCEPCDTNGALNLDSGVERSFRRELRIQVSGRVAAELLLDHSGFIRVW